MAEEKSRVLDCGGMRFANLKKELDLEDELYLQGMDLWLHEIEHHIASDEKQGECNKIAIEEMRKVIWYNKEQIKISRKRVKRCEKVVKDFLKEEGYI